MRMEETTELERYRRMRESIEERYAEVSGRMEQLKAEGKIKSATYRQYYANKMMYKNMLDLYRLYDL